MITSILKKSTPFNSVIFAVLIFIFYTLYNYTNEHQVISINLVVTKLLLLLLFFASFFAVNFIVKKNNLTKDSDYVILFFLLFLLFFPSILSNFKLVFSNLLVLLALRRLYSLQTLKFVKEKIFDASFYICLASIFQFWSILFLILVFLSVLFYVSRDYRNWFLPFVGIATAFILFILYVLIFNKMALLNYKNSAEIDLNFTYFKSNFQNLALSIFTVVSVFFVGSLLLILPAKPLNQKAAYKQTIVAFVIGVSIFILSGNKSNDILLFSFFPLTIIATSDFEHFSKSIRANIFATIIIVLALICFFTQL